MRQQMTAAYLSNNGMGTSQMIDNLAQLEEQDDIQNMLAKPLQQNLKLESPSHG
jgi:hypothetical protein